MPYQFDDEPDYLTQLTQPAPAIARFKFDDEPPQTTNLTPPQDAPEQPSVDMFDTVADNALQGATFGIGNRAASGLAALVQSGINGQPVADNYKAAREMGLSRLSTEMDQNPLAAILSNIGGGIATGGLAAGTAPGAAITASLGRGSALARIGKGAGAGAVSGGAYGAGTADYDKTREGAEQGAIYGALAGGAIPGVIGAGKAAVNAVIPKIDEAIQPLAARARDFGIPLRLDQVSPTRVRKTVQKVSQELPFSGADAFETTQRKAWNKQVAKTIGQDAEDLGPHTIQNFIDDASDKFSSTVGKEAISIGDDSIKTLDNIVTDASDSVTGDVANIVQKNVEKLKADIADGSISGEKLASFRSSLVKRIPKADSQARAYLGDIVDFVDEMAGKSLSTKQQLKLNAARKEWRNFRTIEPLLEKSTDGFINPTDLMSRVQSTPYIKASRLGVGEDDLVDLARIGKQFLPKAGGSDTFQKSLLGGGLGAAGLTAFTNPALAVGGVAAAGTTLGLNRALQGLNTSQRAVGRSIEKSALQGLEQRKPLKIGIYKKKGE